MMIIIMIIMIITLTIIIMMIKSKGNREEKEREWLRESNNGTRNQERMRVLHLCAATDLDVTNTFFRKRNSQLVNTTQQGVQSKLITFWLEEQSWNSLRMLKLSEMKNASHNTNYLLQCSRFKLPLRSHVSLLQSESYGDYGSQKYRLNT